MFIYLFVCLMCGTGSPHATAFSGGQRTSCRSQVSLSTIELNSEVLCGNPLNHPTSPHVGLRKSRTDLHWGTGR